MSVAVDEQLGRTERHLVPFDRVVSGDLLARENRTGAGHGDQPCEVVVGHQLGEDPCPGTGDVRSGCAGAAEGCQDRVDVCEVPVERVGRVDVATYDIQVWVRGQRVGAMHRGTHAVAPPQGFVNEGSPESTAGTEDQQGLRAGLIAARVSWSVAAVSWGVGMCHLLTQRTGSRPIQPASWS